jgi:putative methionine-R-sulfoxide reductase with GAF domain
VGLLGLIGTPGQGHCLAWPVDRVRQFGDRKEGRTMPIDPALLAKSIATLTDLDPQRDLAATLEQAVVAAKQLFAVDAAGIMLADADGRLRWASASDPLAQALEDNQESFAAGPCLQAFTSGRSAVMRDATLEPEWGELTLAFVELEIRSGLSVPVQLGGGPIGTLDVYAAAPGGWDATEVSALQTYAGLVATLLGAAAKAQTSGRLTEQLRVALDARILLEQTKGALMERERLDDRQAFIDLRRAARSSRREPPDGAGEPVVGLPRPHGRAEPAGAAVDGAHQLDVGALDGNVAAFLERKPGADGVGRKLSLLLLGFLATEVVPLADRLAELGIDPTPLFATISGILRLYADTLEHPELRR